MTVSFKVSGFTTLDVAVSGAGQNKVFFSPTQGVCAVLAKTQ